MNDSEIAKKMNEEYNKLNELVYILGLSDENYQKAVFAYIKNPYDAVKKYLGFEDDDNEISDLSKFIYHYISESNITYFHNFNSKGYTKGLKNLVKNYKIEQFIDFDSIESKEPLYEEILIDILTSLIDYELKKEKKTIFSISIGEANSLYFVLDYNKFLEIKRLNSIFLTIYDMEFFEKKYGIIYKLKENDERLKNIVEKNDFIMENKDVKGRYITLFDSKIIKNKTISNLSEEQVKNLMVVL